MTNQFKNRLRVRALPAAILIIAAVNAGLIFAFTKSHHQRPAHLVYTAQGYGGYVPAAKTATATAGKPVQEKTDALQPSQDAYNAGQYKVAETTAAQFLTTAPRIHADPQKVASARQILAYSAARQHDMISAREQFALLREEAAKLPGHGRQDTTPGEVTPTLEAEAAYQHAVCTAALGDKAAAEVEYVAFMKRYPDSPLLSAAMKRIQWMHNGTMPPGPTAVWEQAKAIAAKNERIAGRKDAMCGPECLAEILRRAGTLASVPTLANDMGTDASGTTLAQFVHTAGRKGIPLEGLSLTQQGLKTRKFPVVALLKQGHYVLVDAVTTTGVSIWDPDANGTGHPEQQMMSLGSWKQSWSGLALASPSAASSQTQDVKG